jgi:uncharacterized membrane protein YfhO
MRLMGVRFYLWPAHNIESAPPDNENFNFIKTYEEAGTQLWEVKDYQSRFTFKTQALVTKSQEEIIKALLQADKYNLSHNSVLIFDNNFYQKAVSLVMKDNNPKVKNTTIKLIEQKNNNFSLNVTVPESGYLVISDRYDNGWVAYDNSIETPILNANYYQQAIRISSGYHKIKFIYKPFSFIVGIDILPVLKYVGF